jgi:hypothetical protein
MTIDTILVCVCEDCDISDGITRPFFMSRGLMEVMQELKSVAILKYRINNQNRGGEAGQAMMVPVGLKFCDQQ